MSKTVFYYLKIDGKFVNLLDMDEILCQLMNIEVSDKTYMIPGDNRVSWKEVLTSILLDLPYSKCRNNIVSLDDVIEAVYHFRTEYVIDDVYPYIKCFHLMKVLGATIVVHFENLSMFDDQSREHYRHLYDDEIWMSKQDLFDYVHQLDIAKEVGKHACGILRELYFRKNMPFENGFENELNQF